jgi:hypothetical protein
VVDTPSAKIKLIERTEIGPEIPPSIVNVKTLEFESLKA